MHLRNLGIAMLALVALLAQSTPARADAIHDSFVNTVNAYRASRGLPTVAVSPTLQGGGVGHAMLAECERAARVDWRCREMRMTVISVREELIAWYVRRGYRATGETKPFPYGDPKFGLPKRDDLEFIVLAKPLSPA